MSKKEYIEKEAAIKSLDETSCYLCRKFLPDSGKCDVDCIVYRNKLMLNELPSADVKSVVLCKDCKYYLMDECINPRYGSLGYRDRDFYCADGERRRNK